MEFDPTLVQCAITIPVTIALVLYILLRHDRSTLHLLIAALLALVVGWLSALMVGRAAEPESTIRLLAFHLEHLTIAAMSPLFVLAMGLFARSPAFEQSRAATLALASIFATFFAFYLTNDHHGLYISDLGAALRSEHPSRWGGPLYWANQAWCLLCSIAAVGLVVHTAWRGRTPSERKRALMVLGAIFVPVAAHTVYLAGWLPLDYSLAPGALAPTAVFFVHGVSRYGLLVGQPIMRRDVIEHIDDGFILADSEGIVLDANAAAERALGVGRAHIRAKPLTFALSRLQCPERDTPVGERILVLPPGGRLSEEVRAGDGRSIEITAGAVAQMGSQPGGRFVSLRDRTQQRRSEQLLQDSQKLESVGMLAAGVAHEVNNPLAYVRANLSHLQTLAEGLEKELGLEPEGPGADLLEFPEILSESLEGLDRIGRIVDSMLHFSRLPGEGVCEVEIDTLVEDALRLAALHRNRRVRVDRKLAPGLPRVLGSPQRLVQVVLNLLINAKQALSDAAEGSIGVEATHEGGQVAIRVRDNGPGISEQHRRQIFDPFFTTRSPGEGTGLGLSIAFDIVREHGGTLECSSQLGRGTCFTVRLPVHESAVPA